MTFRPFWKEIIARHPKAHAIHMGDGFRIVKDFNPKSEMEFYSLGNGNSRYSAWKDAAERGRE